MSKYKFQYTTNAFVNTFFISAKYPKYIHDSVVNYSTILIGRKDCMSVSGHILCVL